MTRPLFPLLALPLALAAAACSSSFDDRYQAALPLDQRLPIEVTTKVELQDIQTDGGGRLTPQGQQDAAAFMAAYKRDGAGSIEIQVGRGGRLGAAAESQLREMAQVYGIPARNIRLANYVPEPGSTATTRLAFGRYTASVPACENADWSQNLSMTWDNSTYPSFGCATQQNVAAMVADPRDLIRPHAIEPGSAERRDVVNGHYVKGESPSGARTAGDSGKINDMQSGTEKK